MNNHSCVFYRFDVLFCPRSSTSQSGA